jgi:hypothetical protein
MEIAWIVELERFVQRSRPFATQTKSNGSSVGFYLPHSIATGSLKTASTSEVRRVAGEG